MSQKPLRFGGIDMNPNTIEPPGWTDPPGCGDGFTKENLHDEIEGALKRNDYKEALLNLAQAIALAGGEEQTEVFWTPEAVSTIIDALPVAAVNAVHVAQLAQKTVNQEAVMDWIHRTAEARAA
jgi:hypothetical protein